MTRKKSFKFASDKCIFRKFQRKTMLGNRWHIWIVVVKWRQQWCSRTPAAWREIRKRQVLNWELTTDTRDRNIGPYVLSGGPWFLLFHFFSQGLLVRLAYVTIWSRIWPNSCGGSMLPVLMSLSHFFNFWVVFLEVKIYTWFPKKRI